jgi:4'-phosphopantetheinyl transferase EntD
MVQTWTVRRKLNSLDTTHQTAEALTRLLPEAITAGGSFSAWLPAPHLLSPSDRRLAFTSSQKRAVDQCLATLLRRAGIDETTPIGTGEGGARRWPPGFVGSLTHKGTVVLSTIAQTSAVQMIGIDLDRLDRSDLTTLETTIAPEGLPTRIDRERGILLSFSAKEAVFKAQYPISRQMLSFADVRLDWELDRKESRALATCPAGSLIVRCAIVQKWVIAAAFSTRRASFNSQDPLPVNKPGV